MVKFYRIFLLCAVFLLSGGIYGQLSAQRSVSGTVVDERGDPMPGVTILVKGTMTGVVSLSDGTFHINMPADEAVLEVSFIGYASQEVPVSVSMGHVRIVMREANLQMDEIVVTAFATQKKVNVTGAISSVGGAELVATPVSNIANALIGNTPGVGGLQTSGEPGQNSADIKIRGISTYGTSTPLIVIDGVEQATEQAFSEFNSMDPNEIESISVLKDAASTAVFGIRGANGVILVTTKRGRVGKPVINFSSSYGITKATVLQEGTTAYEYALMRNEAIRHGQRSFAGWDSFSANIYSDYDLWKFKNNRDYTPVEIDAMNLSQEQKELLRNQPALYYASHNLYKEQFNKAGPQWQANLNISGGTDRVKYFASFGYFSQEGITSNVNYYDAQTGSKFDRYNFRTNFDIQVFKNLKVSINSSGQFGQTKGPGASSDPYDLSSRYKIIMQYIYDGNPFISPGIIDGKLVSGFHGTAGTPQNPLAAKTDSSIGNQNAVHNLLTSGMNTVTNSLLDNVVKIEHTMDYLLSGLRIYGTVSYQDNYNRRSTYWPSLPSYTVQRDATDPTRLNFYGGSMGGGSFDSWGYSNWNKLYLDAGTDWSGSFDKHNVSVLLLGKASRYTMPGGGYNVPSGIVGFVGRVTYNYDNRYMLEFNAGYNGTEQFDKGNRFGFFPAVSAGWVPTLEKFFPENDILTFMKIRFSYGEVGNDQLGGSRRYYYLPNTYNLNQGGYYIGNSDGTYQNTYYAGATEGTLGNPAITWERSRKYDVGLELGMLNDRLTIVGDWFREDRSSILTTLGTIPAIYGVSTGSAPPANIGKTKNQGYELSVSWSERRGDFTYTVGADISYAKNKIIYRAEAPNPYYWMNQTGFSIGQRYGLKSDGLFNTLEELHTAPYNTFASQITLGDIKYKDLNGDGVIDSNDIAPIGYPNYPQYHFGFKVRVTYKGFDLRLLFNGTANGSYYLNNGITRPFVKNAGNAWKWMYDGRWTQEKYESGAKITYPRASYNPNSGDNNWQTSDYWMVSNNFFKLKNIELGYTFDLAKGRTRNFHIQNLRVFANANNIFTFGNARLKDIGIDPETTDGSTYIYPLTRIVNIGLSLQF